MFRGMGLGGVTLMLFASAFALSSGTETQCGNGTVNASSIASQDRTIDGFSGDQLANAALIMNAATDAGLPQAAQVIGVMTAVGESSLRNLTYGDNIRGATNPDGTSTTSLGLFQQQDWWGDRAARLNPYKSATLFYGRLTAVPHWQTLTPTQAAHLVQANDDPDYYTPFVAAAADIVSQLGGTGTSANCGASSDAQTLAAELVTHANDGTLVGLVPDHIKEIRWMAQGKSVPDCGIDTRILQVIAVAVRYFHTVGVSDINRRCTGQILGAGTGSSHYVGGGGMAVDFFMIDGVPLTGADGLSLRLIALIAPELPEGARLGQSECRASLDRILVLEHLTQFSDTCDHLHVDVASAAGDLGHY